VSAHRRSKSRVVAPLVALGLLLLIAVVALQLTREATAPSARPDSGAPDPTPTPIPTPTPSPSPTATAAPTRDTPLGTYNGGAHEQPDEKTEEDFGVVPEVTSVYLPLATSDLDLDYERARIRRGTAINISFGTRGTQFVEGLATGAPGATAWLDRQISDASALADTNPDVPVYVTLDQEFKVKVRDGLITGPSTDPLIYGQALAALYARVDAADRANLLSTYWIVGSDRAFEALPPQGWGSTRPDVVVFDPYARQASQSLAEVTAADIEWIKAQPWWDGQPLGLGEFGMVTSSGDAALAAFFTDVRSQLDDIEAEHDVDIAFATFFNRAKDRDHQIAGRTDGVRFDRAVRAFSSSLRDEQGAPPSGP
jgi:hypothetical protein